ncbi:MAG: amino acid ABC transporter permease [Zoogloeaceae bacterium]|jgi:polar amino acid transport system permease protein|nr:amino acid ABC transporter permease [Zoogloeaceae bacterium]
MSAPFDWSYFERLLPLYASALWLTLWVAAVSTVLAVLIGAANGAAQFYRLPFFARLGKSYAALFRNTPLMIQLFFLFYALPKLGLILAPTTCALLGLTLLGGAYMSEAFKGGLSAVKAHQVEAGLALGMSRWQCLRFVLLPQAWSYSLPALGANAIFLFKETSIFSIIGVMDLMNVSKTQIGLYYKTHEALALLVSAYALVLIPMSFGLSWLEKKARHAEFGH